MAKKIKNTTHLDSHYLAFAFLMICAVIMLFPFVWMIFSSFKPHEDVFAYGARILPVHWDFSNYSYGWSGFGGITFTTFFSSVSTSVDSSSSLV